MHAPGIGMYSVAPAATVCTVLWVEPWEQLITPVMVTVTVDPEPLLTMRVQREDPPVATTSPPPDAAARATAAGPVTATGVMVAIV